MHNSVLGLFIFLFGLVIALAFLYEPRNEPQTVSTRVENIPSKVSISPAQTPSNLPIPSPIVPENKETTTTTNHVATLEQPYPPTAPPVISTEPEQEQPPKSLETEPQIQIIHSGPTTSKRIAITFDDGPHPRTQKVLDTLRERNIKATFFVLGEKVKLFPRILKQTAAEGHEIGNHTYSHPHRTFKTMANDLVDHEITETQHLIKNALGYEPYLFRPPGGKGVSQANIRSILQEHHLHMILWSVDTRDWETTDRDQILNTIITETHNGSIILCHDIHPVTLEVLPDILDTLLAKGYEFVTISQLCGLQPPKIEVALPSVPTTEQAKALDAGK